MGETASATSLVLNASAGDRRAADQLLPLVYDELRRLAAGLLHQERAGHTLQATALVHEAYLKLIDQTRAQWRDQTHFFAVAAQAIRRILVDHARGKHAAKRGGNRSAFALDSRIAASYEQAVDLVALDDALRRLAAVDAQQARLVEMRFFAGLTIEETAVALGASTSTVERNWRYARAWLYRELSEGPVPLGDVNADDR